MKYSNKFKKKMVKKWSKNKGKSLSLFCKENDLSPRSLMRWVKQTEAISKQKQENVLDYSKLKYIITQDSLSLFLNGESRVLHLDNANYIPVVNNILSGEYKSAWELSSVKDCILKFSDGSLEVKNGSVFMAGIKVHNSMSEKLLEMLKQGENGVKAFSGFMKKLMLHSNQNVIDQLYNFLQHNSIEINDDGSFFGYKAVRSDFKDIHTGTIDNSVGASPMMARLDVDDNPDEPCSTGLHVGSYEYAKNFANRGDKIVKIKVYPEDVVSVPVDYNGQKLRACRYEVVSFVGTKGEDL